MSAIKQFECTYESERDFVAELAEASALYAACPTALFHIFCERQADEEVDTILRAIRTSFPHALIAGASAWGTIVDGDFVSGSITITGTFFERPSTKVEVLTYPLGHDTAAEVAARLVSEVEARPWVKAVEALVMNNDEPLDDFCQVMSDMREDVIIFGGESHYNAAFGVPRFVIGNDGPVEWGASFVLLGGPDLHFLMRYVQGWKPLGAELHATSFEGNVLHEIDGRPAFDLYHRYLQIENDENFQTNALEFPLLFWVDETTFVLRTPLVCLEDGSFVLASPIPPSARLKIGCGDPDEILETVANCGYLISDFRPEAILAFSCAGRRLFWRDAGSARETLPFQSIAPTAGFYTMGELLRVNGRLLEHNSTLVVAAAREGSLEEQPPVHYEPPRWRRRRSLVSRFACFIDAAMAELQEANRRLETLSKTDGLTGLLNRREIERIIRAACAGDAGSPGSLVMMDLDDFKQINDTHGHAMGDDVLVHFAHIVSELCERSGMGSKVGRWGGEEFIILVPGVDEHQASHCAERLRDAFASSPTNGVNHTLSLGVTRIKPAESADAALSRVDEALYLAKHRGKNRVAIL